MFKFPHEYQLDSKDCGPACIKIVAKHYGVFYSLQYLRDLCGITREGISLFDLSTGCEQIGLRTLSVKLNWEEIQKVPLPCIVQWENNHFIVVYKLSKKKVWVSDPAKGLITHMATEFIKGWLINRDRWAVLLIENL